MAMLSVPKPIQSSRVPACTAVSFTNALTPANAAAPRPTLM